LGFRGRVGVRVKVRVRVGVRVSSPWLMGRAECTWVRVGV